MKATPRASVVIPSRNSAEWAERAVRSVLEQDLAELEILLVDDASGPEHAARLDALARSAGIALLRQPRAGPDRARRRGWEAARGPYVAFLDDDDRYLPGHLEASLALLDAEPEAGAAYGRYREVDAEGRPGAVRPRRGYSGRCFAEEVRKGSVKTSTLVVRRAALLELSGLRESQRSGGNYDLILRLRYRLPFLFLEEPRVEVTKRPGSLSSDASQRDRAKAEILENLLLIHPEMSGPERRAVKRKLARYWAKAGDAARRQRSRQEALQLYRRSLASGLTPRGLGGWLRSRPGTP